MRNNHVLTPARFVPRAGLAVRLGRVAAAALALAGSVRLFAAPEPPPTVDVFELAERLAPEKTSDFLRQALVGQPLAPSAAQREAGATLTIAAGQMIPVSVQPRVSRLSDAKSALEAVAKLPELHDAYIAESLGRVWGNVRADELELLANNGAVAFVDRQAPPLFNRTGSVAPSSMVPNRIAEIRAAVADLSKTVLEDGGSTISLTGEGLKIGVISDGIAGSLWFRQEPSGASFDVNNCDPDADTSFTVVRVNPILPIGYQDIYEGDTPSRSFDTIVDQVNPIVEAGEPTRYIDEELIGSGFSSYPFWRVEGSGIYFRSENPIAATGSYPWSVADAIYGNGEMDLDQEDNCIYRGDPFFTDDYYTSLTLRFTGNINEEVMRTITNDFGLLANEGAAFIDIIRDYVPDAEYYFINAHSPLAFLRALDALHSAVGCDLIATDLSFIGDVGPLDGSTNVLALAIEDAATEIKGGDGGRPSVVVAAGGNFARVHHRSFINDSDSDGLHAFSGTDEALRVRISNGESVLIFLTWDERFIDPSSAYQLAKRDLNLFILDPADPSLARPIVSSRNPQNGSVGSLPIEGGFLTNNTGGTMNVDIVVTVPLGTPSSLPIDLWVAPSFSSNGAEMREYITPDHSMPAISEARYAISIGDLSPSPLAYNTVSSTSSRGPVSSPDPAIGDILKPDFVSFSNIENGTDNLFVAASAANLPSDLVVGALNLSQLLSLLPGNSPLTGSSGAAADAAGMIAMYLSYADSVGLTPTPSGTSDELHDFILDSLGAGALDLTTTAGPDNVAGRGRINPYGTIYPDVLERNPLVSRYFYRDFNTLAEKQTFSPQSQQNLGFVPAALGSTSAVEPNGLTLTANDNTNTWGYFWSNTIVFDDGNSTISSDKVYRVRVRVSEDFDILPSPILRIRAQARNSSVIHTHVFNDQPSLDTSDGYVRERQGGAVFTHYFRPSPSAESAGMEINIDLISTDPDFAIGKALLVQEVEVLELNGI